MSKNWFEQNMNEKLSGKAEDIDLDANWKAIQAKRSKKKRRVLLYWFVLPGVLIILAGSSIYLTSDRGNLKDQESISSTALPLASKNVIEKNVTQSATITTNEDTDNSKLDWNSGIQTLKQIKKKDSKKYAATASQTIENNQTTERSKASINQPTVATRISESNSEIAEARDESDLEKHVFEIKKILQSCHLNQNYHPCLNPPLSLIFHYLMQKFKAKNQLRKLPATG
ncbi:MAG: hypothetical protein IPI60_07555 [Saprospiraceae bacterium]|nr:hypothetical protein [Saprospiraceae bacterium]